jgi:hypothetical protein
MTTKVNFDLPPGLESLVPWIPDRTAAPVPVGRPLAVLARSCADARLPGPRNDESGGQGLVDDQFFSKWIGCPEGIRGF